MWQDCRLREWHLAEKRHKKYALKRAKQSTANGGHTEVVKQTSKPQQKPDYCLLASAQEHMELIDGNLLAVVQFIERSLDRINAELAQQSGSMVPFRRDLLQRTFKIIHVLQAGLRRR